MEFEELMSRVEDTGLREETLIEILNRISNDSFDIRKLYLPSDRKVYYFKDDRKSLSAVDREKYQRQIFEKIAESIKNNTSHDPSIDEIKFDNNLSGKSDLFFTIYFMSKIDDFGGSKRKDIFEKVEQKTSETCRYTKRIYLNIPINEIGAKFLTLFKMKCIEKGIPSKMKGFGSSASYTEEMDTTIIYSNDYYFIQHISILEEIVKEYPDIVSTFGSPVVSGGRVKSNDGNCYYTIDSGLLNGNTPNDFYERLYKTAFVILCLHIIDGKEINDDLIKHYSNSKVDVELSRYRLLIKEKNIDINSFTGLYKELVKKIASYKKFGDFAHVDIPLYQDEIFVKYVSDNKSKSKENNETFKIIITIGQLIGIAISKYKKDNNVGTLIEQITLIKLRYQDMLKNDSYSSMVLFNYFSKFDKLIGLKYVKDDSKGDYINQVQEKEYYNDLKKQIDEIIDEIVLNDDEINKIVSKNSLNK